MSVNDDNIRALEKLAAESGVSFDYLTSHLEDPENYPIPPDDTTSNQERGWPLEK